MIRLTEKKKKLSVTTTLFIMLLGIVFASNYFYLLKEASSLENMVFLEFSRVILPYERVLKSAKWPVKRYEFFKFQNKMVSKNNMKAIETQMLQLTFGFNYDHFLLRNFSGESIVEIRKGALSSRKSEIHIYEGDELFSSISPATIIRPCLIDSLNYICIIDIPYQRNFLPVQQRVYVLVSIAVDDLLMRSNYLEKDLSSHFIAPQIFVEIEGEKYDFYNTNNSYDSHTIIHKISPVDRGIKLHISFSFWRYFFISFLLSFIVFSLGHLFLKFFIKNLKNKINSKHEYELLSNKLKSYDQLQKTIADVLHDIRSPISSLKTLSNIETSLEKQQLLKHVVNRLTLLSKDLEWKKSSSSGLGLFPVLASLRLILMEKNREYNGEYDILLNVDEDLELWTRGSYSNFLRVMSNLINNAIEASQKMGLIKLSCSKCGDDRILITVQDNGIGINNEDITRLFQRGFTKGKENGSGIGLAFSKQVIESMSGTISIHSVYGSGTKVIINLPLEPFPKWALETLDLKQFSRIFVVDDEVQIHEYWKKKLEITNFKVEYLLHPSELNQKKLSEEDLVIIDNNFTNEYGAGLQYIRESDFNQFVLMTSEWMLGEIQRSVDQEGCRLIAKDFISDVEIVYE